MLACISAASCGSVGRVRFLVPTRVLNDKQSVEVDAIHYTNQSQHCRCKMVEDVMARRETRLVALIRTLELPDDGCQVSSLGHDSCMYPQVRGITSEAGDLIEDLRTTSMISLFHVNLVTEV